MIRIKSSGRKAREVRVGAYVSYQLRIIVDRDLKLKVGRLGVCRFPAGHYTYTGSALRNMEARLARHLRPAKRLRWHIDYLLCSPGVEVQAVRRFRDPECVVNSRSRGMVQVPGFGASDCRAGCGAHLKYMATRQEEK